MIRKLLCTSFLLGACATWGGTFLDSLQADPRKVDSSPVASGGDIILKDGNDYIHVFTKSGTFTAPYTMKVRALVVGGGGSGGYGFKGPSGGGGAGGMIERTDLVVAGGGIEVVVGKGGDNSSNGATGGVNGGDSFLSGVTAYGGGGGGGNAWGGTAAAGSAGGSGGGTQWHGNNSAVRNAGGAGIAGQGNCGGSITVQPSAAVGSGGGGAGSAAPDITADNQVGTGGDGKMCDILGFEQYFAGGGAGFKASVAVSGGQGGGASTVAGSDNPVAGEDGLGGGGSGRQGNGGGAKGGDGIVIIRYSEDVDSYMGGIQHLAENTQVHSRTWENRDGAVEGNLIAGKVAAFIAGATPISRDYKRLTDGTVQNGSTDTTDVRLCGNGATDETQLQWNFDGIFDVEDVRFYTCWGDTRAIVTVSKIEFQTSSGWTEVPGSAFSAGENGQQNLVVFRSTVEGEKLVTGATAVRITFSNSAAGGGIGGWRSYREIEVMGEPNVPLTVAATASRKAGNSLVTTLTLTEGGADAIGTIYAAYGAEKAPVLGEWAHSEVVGTLVPGQEEVTVGVPDLAGAAYVRYYIVFPDYDGQSIASSALTVASIEEDSEPNPAFGNLAAVRMGPVSVSLALPVVSAGAGADGVGTLTLQYGHGGFSNRKTVVSNGPVLGMNEVVVSELQPATEYTFSATLTTVAGTVTSGTATFRTARDEFPAIVATGLKTEVTTWEEGTLDTPNNLIFGIKGAKISGGTLNGEAYQVLTDGKLVKNAGSSTVRVCLPGADTAGTTTTMQWDFFKTANIAQISCYSYAASDERCNTDVQEVQVLGPDNVWRTVPNSRFGGGAKTGGGAWKVSLLADGGVPAIIAQDAKAIRITFTSTQILNRTARWRNYMEIEVIEYAVEPPEMTVAALEPDGASLQVRLTRPEAIASAAANIYRTIDGGEKVKVGEFAEGGTEAALSLTGLPGSGNLRFASNLDGDGSESTVNWIFSSGVALGELVKPAGGVTLIFF